MKGPFPLISIQEKRLGTVCRDMAGKRVAVIGDIMLDRYLWGKVHRLSPEAPVPVIDLDREQFHLGGASNVARNIHSLGGIPVLVGVVGDDGSSAEVIRLIEEAGFSPGGIFRDPTRPTTVKTRIIAQSQHVARVDRETRGPLAPGVRQKLTDFLGNEIGNIDGIIFEDYNKGVIGKDLIADVTGLAARRGIPVTVDPKFDNFFDYRGVTVFKPNRKEVEDALGVKLGGKEDFEEAGKAILAKLGAKSVLFTLGDQGMMLFEDDGSVSHVPTKARKVADVSGAGDTVIATLTMALLGGATLREAASLANYGGGLVCGYVGIVPVDREELVGTVLAELNHRGGSRERE